MMNQSSRLNWFHIDDCSDIKNRMIPNMRLAAFLVMALLATALKAQDLEPRLYVNLPVNQNFVGLVTAYSEGAVLNSANVPVEDASLYYNSVIAAYVRTFSLNGNSAKIDTNIPYSCVKGSAVFEGVSASREECAQGDLRLRFSYNFWGAPALSLQEYAQAARGTTAGFSVQLSAPTGHYDSTKLINIGANRWFIKPEIGISIPWRKFSNEFALGATFFSNDDDFLGRELKQEPVVNVQWHLIYNLTRRQWLALNTNYFFGGDMEVDGSPLDSQENRSRLGLTWGLSLNRQHSLKLSAHTGVITQIGNDMDTYVLGWTYRWE
jgi:hypothetical protein